MQKKVNTLRRRLSLTALQATLQHRVKYRDDNEAIVGKNLKGNGHDQMEPYSGSCWTD
jgi:hypothetical protein